MIPVYITCTRYSSFSFTILLDLYLSSCPARVHPSSSFFPFPSFFLLLVLLLSPPTFVRESVFPYCARHSFIQSSPPSSTLCFLLLPSIVACLLARAIGICVVGTGHHSDRNTKNGYSCLSKLTADCFAPLASTTAIGRDDAHSSSSLYLSPLSFFVENHSTLQTD